jgi:hypothetical protein
MITAMRRSICAVLILSLGCATPQRRSNETIALFLAHGTDASDPRLSPIIERVLTDIEQGTYRYDDEVRKYVFDAISALRPQDDSLRARIRLIAKRPIPAGNSRPALLEFVAVLGALSLLTQLNDEDAVSLNTARLTDTALRQAAIDDLRLLKAWEATDQAESAFAAFLLRRRHDPTDPVVLASYLLFLSESPRTSPSVCVGVTRSLSDVESCCIRAYAAGVDLKDRLRCPTSGE